MNAFYVTVPRLIPHKEDNGTVYYEVTGINNETERYETLDTAWSSFESELRDYKIAVQATFHGLDLTEELRDERRA